MTIDISRAAYDPRKRYASVRMQQGRVILDDDFNDAERIDDELERRELIDIIGPTGSPDDGFKVDNGRLNPLGKMTFDIKAGTLYLGGLRLWNHELHTYALQEDWLQQPASERAVPADGRVDLVYLEAWQQSVTAVEDSELFEAALAGPDTSARLRTMWRVHLATGVTQSDCATAWQTLIGSWQAAKLGVVDANGERKVDAQLTVGFEAGTESDDLCSPPVAGGYLGAENQAIRVQLVDSSHMIWGFDNAAPLYRVQVGEDRVTITLETEPKDQAHWPLAGQIVEILPWSAVLPNNEKVAELSGHLSRVAGSYDPDSHTLTLSTEVPANFGEEWKAREDQLQLGAPYYFLRVWNRGDDVTSDVSIPFTVGTAVVLGNTGLNVKFTGTQFVKDDHWVIAARPETPDQVVPWRLENGKPPNGVRRYYTPLAIIRWDSDQSGISFDVLSDCRVPFQPLTRLRGCCTYTVGDKKTSWGQFDTIQAAVNNLPPEGGKVCVLPGEYIENVILFAKNNVTIEGCDRRSRLIAIQDKGDDIGAAILIVQSQDIVIRNLFIDGIDRPGILIFDTRGPTAVGAGNPDVPRPPVLSTGDSSDAVIIRSLRTEEILLEGLEINVKALPAVAAIGGRRITLRDSFLLGNPPDAPIGTGPNADQGRWPLVFMLSDDVLIENNEITCSAEFVDSITSVGGLPTFVRMGMGGIQIGGGSERVEIRRNFIHFGNGNGITLGSVAWVRKSVADTGDFPKIKTSWEIAVPGGGFITNDDGCIEVGWDPDPPDSNTPNDPLVPVSMGALRDIRILDNTIENMGSAGVGVARYFNLSGRDEFIIVDHLRIEQNRIRGCLRLPIPELPVAMRDLAAAGAIALAMGEYVVIRTNIIEQNGRTHVDPVCGVFSLFASGFIVDGNIIRDNAPRTNSEEPPRPGLRGGVVVLFLRPPTTTILVTVLDGEALRGTGFPAARVHGNIIVVPEGRTLILSGIGAYQVTDNQLTSRGVGTANLGAGRNRSGGGAFSNALDILGGATVALLNAGWSNELTLQLLNYQNISDIEVEPTPGPDPIPPVLTGGDIMFNDNQVKLDLMEATLVAILSSMIFITFDDISFNANQCEVEQDRDLLGTNLLALAWSIRASNNRFEEQLIATDGVVDGLSAFALAALGTMSSNQSSHCLMLTATLPVFVDNIELIRAFTDGACAGSRAATGGRFKQFVGVSKSSNG